MAQRLIFKTDVIKDVVKTFDTMYVADKLYDYSNFITIYGRNGRLFFEMCVIMNGASNDAMVRLYEDSEGLVDFDKLIVNFTELKSIVKAIKSDEMFFDLDGKNLTIIGGKSTHTSEASTVAIPKQIVTILDSFMENNQENMVDFNLVKLYNNMNDIGSNLTMNTLKVGLFGVMSTPKFMVSTDGISMSIYTNGQLPEQFMFPKHSLLILKMLPKIGAKFKIIDHRLFIVGVGFECYIGEWSGYKEYPVSGVARLMDMEMTKIMDGPGAISAIKACHMFDDVAIVYFGQGYATNHKKTHRETFEPTPEFGDKAMIIGRSVLTNLDSMDFDNVWVNPDKFMGRIEDESRIHIFMAMKPTEGE